MTDKAIQQQMDALKSITTKALQSKKASTELLNRLSNFSPVSRSYTKATTMHKKVK